jgi:hypothetical protein
MHPLSNIGLINNFYDAIDTQISTGHKLKKKLNAKAHSFDVMKKNESVSSILQNRFIVYFTILTE